MKTSKQISKELLLSCQTIHNKTTNQKLTVEIKKDLKTSLKLINDFFKLQRLEGLVLSILIQNTLIDEQNSIKNLITHFRDDTLIIPQINEVIEKLFKKNLIYIINRKKYRRGELTMLKTINVNNKVIEAIMTGDINQMQLKRVNNFSSFLEDLMDLVSLKTEGLINAEILFTQAKDLIESNKSLPQLQWLCEMQLSQEDKLVFLIGCHRYYTNSDGEEEVMVISILDDIMDETSDKFKYKKTFRNEENKLVLNNLIEADTDWMFTSLAYRLTREAKDAIFEIEATNKVVEYKPRKGDLIKSDSIIPEELYYNATEERQIELLENALIEANFKTICTKLKANSLKAGFTILLHGEAGTGKTATVKQLAKLSGRNIFTVEVNKIKNAYVGETEKAIKEVFVEYRKLCKLYDNIPILLFNEADAIISKRITVQRSVDQMNNSMQNILLQELEDFEGIFIATTNLASNLDDAFDRKFLYKIEYKKPQPNVRLKILQNNFEQIDDEVLLAINEKYVLTGGQIMNLKKKLLVQNLLEPRDLNEMIWMACEDEMSLNMSKLKNQIGFIQN